MDLNYSFHDSMIQECYDKKEKEKWWDVGVGSKTKNANTSSVKKLIDIMLVLFFPLTKKYSIFCGHQEWVNLSSTQSHKLLEHERQNAIYFYVLSVIFLISNYWYYIKYITGTLRSSCRD